MTSRRKDAPTFIDFELGGPHYRGYDLFKLFRTSGNFSEANFALYAEAAVG